MNLYTEIDDSGYVINVIVCEKSIIDSGSLGTSSRWIETFEDGRRGNYAGIGYFYNETLDVFIPPAPGGVWELNADTYQWELPKVISIESDKHLLIGDGIDEAVITVTGRPGLHVSIDVLVGETLTSLSLNLSIDTETSLGKGEKIITCDTPASLIVLSYENISEEVLVIYD